MNWYGKATTSNPSTSVLTRKAGTYPCS